MEREEPQTEQMNSERESGKESGIGADLRYERERRGLSVDKMASITKLRVHVIEALENEEWDRLPALVFVKGFIRSYAKALEFDDERISALYKKIGPFGEEQPKPLIEQGRSKKRPVSLVLLILLFGAAAIALFMVYPIGTPDRDTGVVPPVIREESIPKPDLSVPKKEEHELSSELSIPPLDSGGPPSVPEGDRTGDAQATKEVPETPPEQAAPVVPAPAPERAAEGLVLKAFVTSRTWVRILIDSQEPKEYIFQSGARPQWQAKEGFDILVGNAAGIAFDFNGEQIKDLGTLGQVVRLKLPKDFKSGSTGD